MRLGEPHPEFLLLFGPYPLSLLLPLSLSATPPHLIAM
jgi:hypothetical protein